MPPAEKKAPKKAALARFLDAVEWAGNRLPEPATLFVILCLAVVLLSAAVASTGWSVTHPSTGEEVRAVSLLNGEGLRRMLTSAVSNFTGFAPLGMVLVTLLGVGVAEGSGLLAAGLRAVALSAPRRVVTAAVVFTGILSNVASDAGYVVFIPLAALVFRAFGRHPLAGIAAAFAGVSGGFSANLLVGSTDVLLAAITEPAAHIVDESYRVTPLANYYFLFASTFLLTAVGTWITDRVVEPRLGRYESGDAEEAMKRLEPREKRGLGLALAATVGLLALLAWSVVPAGSVLRDPKTGGFLTSPFLSGIVPIIVVLFWVPAVVYGAVVGTIRSDADVARMMAKALSGMGSYLVLVFFAAQFIAFFSWTHLGLITAIEGALGLQAIGLTGWPLLVAFVLVSGAVNLVIASASAKWALMAPVFVPMFMLLGYTPELTLAAFRVADSSTNLVTPMLSYFPLIIALAQRYRKDAGIGTMIALMLPYSIAFLLAWTLFLLGWVALGLPLGPGAPLRLPS
jgi:aminobenzoyl-glutamate transport protein